MDEKVYTTEVITETPFPTDQTQVTQQADSLPSGTYSTTVVKERPLPKPRVAAELIGQALNTRSKKVLQEFDLESSGGFKVGNFEEGVSGDLRITPNGLTARDQSGITTFAIDGTTGDAVFKGTIQAGSLIADSIVTGLLEVGYPDDGQIIVYDSSGLARVLIGRF